MCTGDIWSPQPRTICEVASTPDHSDGLFGEVMNVVLSASSAVGSELGDLVSPKYGEYLRAEKKGKEGDCKDLEENCPVSFFSFR